MEQMHHGKSKGKVFAAFRGNVGVGQDKFINIVALFSSAN